MSELPADVLYLVFYHLKGDYNSLCQATLTCRFWHDVATPVLLYHVDLSSHNLGRQHEYEHDLRPVVYADFHANYRPSTSTLVPRQRAFVRLMTARPALAKCVKSLMWTFVWLDFGERCLSKNTWDVMGRLNRVTHLDMASVHDVYTDDYVRHSPSSLFPSATHVRLLGWMHRGLITAIFATLDARRLRHLDLDGLQDEGAAPGGGPINFEFAVDTNTHTARSRHWSDDLRGEAIDPALASRQSSAEAVIFPGPMWLPMHLLSNRSLDSLAYLRISLVPFSEDIDLRNYGSFFANTARLISEACNTIQHLEIAFGENYKIYEGVLPSGCGTSRVHFRSVYLPWCVRTSALFLGSILDVLEHGSFPKLEHVDLEGFGLLRRAAPYVSNVRSVAGLDDVFRSVAACQHLGLNFVEAPRIDHRDGFLGYDCVMAEVGDLGKVLGRS